MSTQGRCPALRATLDPAGAMATAHRVSQGRDVARGACRSDWVEIHLLELDGNQPSVVPRKPFTRSVSPEAQGGRGLPLLSPGGAASTGQLAEEEDWKGLHPSHGRQEG